MNKRPGRIESACKNKVEGKSWDSRWWGTRFWHPHAGSWSTDWQARPTDYRIWSVWKHANGNHIGGNNYNDWKQNFFRNDIHKGHNTSPNKPDEDVYGILTDDRKYKGFGNYDNRYIKPTTNRNGGNNTNTFPYSHHYTKWRKYGNHLKSSFHDYNRRTYLNKCDNNVSENERKQYMKIYRKRYPRFDDEKCDITDNSINKEKLRGNVFKIFELKSIASNYNSKDVDDNNANGNNANNNQENFTEEQKLNLFYGRVAFIDPFYNVYLYDSNGDFLENVNQLYKAHEMKHFLTDYDVNAIQGGGKLFGTLGTPGNRGSEKINIATRNYTVTGPSKDDISNLERAINYSGFGLNIQTDTEGEFEVVTDKLHWGRSEKGDDKNGGPMMSIVNYREWNLINLYGQKNQYSERL